MFRIVCDKCEAVLEVADSKAGSKIACPECGDINLVPEAPPAPSPIPGTKPDPVRVASRTAAAAATGSVARGERGPRSARDEQSGTAGDRASAEGLPPDDGPEQRVLLIRPCLFRNRPLGTPIVVLLTLGGLVGIGWGLFSEPRWLWILGAVALVIGLMTTAVWWVLRLSNRLEITNKRTVERRGLFSTASSEVVHDNIRNVQIEQSFLERLLGVGNIGISSSGQDGLEIQMRGIRRPREVQRIIDLYRPL